MDVDLLIGSDYYWCFVTGDSRRGEGGIVAVHTRLGWVLSGTTSVPVKKSSSHSHLITYVLHVDASPHCTEHLDEVLQSFWQLESLGIEDKGDSVLNEFAQSVCFREGRYEVSLPWKASHIPLPDDLSLSQKRLQGLLRRLRQDPDTLQEYDSIIRVQLQQGIVEEVLQPDEGMEGRVHYLPHHAIVRKDKETTRVRIVYDASARATGCSLNECLHKGPKIEQRILDILLRFRTHRVALTSDIEKAFLMVSISESDRDVLRFLWVKNVNTDPPRHLCPEIHQSSFWVSCSPFLLNATLQHHLSKYSVSHELVNQLTKSRQNEELAYQLYLDSKSVLKEGGFNLRKFTTNSSSLQQRINTAEEAQTQVGDSEETYAKATLGTTQPVLAGEQKVLGVRWDVQSDLLCFGLGDIAHLAATLEPTKRHLVSVVGKIYDPIGLLSPIVIRFKILFQELCRERLDWDQPLTEGLLKRWNELVEALNRSHTMCLPRCVWTGIATEDTTTCLYGFCDAS